MFLAVELDREILRICADRERGVKRARRIDEEAGAGELAVLVDAADLHDRFRRAREDFLHLAADRVGRLLLRRAQSRAAACNISARASENAHRDSGAENRGSTERDV